MSNDRKHFIEEMFKCPNCGGEGFVTHGSLRPHTCPTCQKAGKLNKEELDYYLVGTFIKSAEQYESLFVSDECSRKQFRKILHLSSIIYRMYCLYIEGEVNKSKEGKEVFWAMFPYIYITELDKYKKEVD